ncbi:hypothetical protein [Flavobacterium sp. HJSW_4]|uniref:hypothetical protein n=1 Tax=Flavobacterium sp. HJSW_4 TaxID=3344660 RepID=UPI0035F24A70
MKNIIQTITFFGTSQIKVSDRIISKNEPIPFANFLLVDKSDKIVSGVDRSFKVFLSYLFCNDKISSRERNFGNEDIRNRRN